MSTETNTFMEIDGEVLPLYEGVNAPHDATAEALDARDARTRLATEGAQILQLADNMPTDTTEDKRDEPSKPSDANLDFPRLLAEEREADRRGTHLGSSPSDYRVAR